MEDETLKLLGEKNFTVAFLDGNHENFPLIKSKETPRQATTESVKERRLNLKGSFKVENKEQKEKK